MKLLRRTLLTIFLIIIVICSIIFANGYKLYKSKLDEINLSDKINQIKSDDTYILIYDVPDYYKNAIIAVEDHRFKDHGAIDLIGIRKSYSIKYKS